VRLTIAIDVSALVQVPPVVASERVMETPVQPVVLPVIGATVGNESTVIEAVVNEEHPALPAV